MKEIVLSNLGHTWILDIDGTLAKHNGYVIEGKDTVLKYVNTFVSQIPAEDMIIILTSRSEDTKEFTEEFLNRNHIRYDLLIYGVPLGERILINDRKPSGLEMAKAISLDRDVGTDINIMIDNEL